MNVGSVVVNVDQRHSGECSWAVDGTHALDVAAIETDEQVELALRITGDKVLSRQEVELLRDRVGTDQYRLLAQGAQRMAQRQQ